MDGIKFAELNLIKFYAELYFEMCGITVTDLDLYVISVYRSTGGNIRTFFELFESALKALKNAESLLAVISILTFLILNHKAQ